MANDTSPAAAFSAPLSPLSLLPSAASLFSRLNDAWHASLYGPAEGRRAATAELETLRAEARRRWPVAVVAVQDDACRNCGDAADEGETLCATCARAGHAAADSRETTLEHYADLAASGRCAS